MAQRDVYLVIGGSGFLGRHIVEALKNRGDTVSVFDIVQRYDDTPFYSGDISDEAQVAQALQKSGATCIIHTASPQHGIEDPALYWKVNVEGTKAIIAAAVACHVSKLVYTSSAGVTFNGPDIVDGDERLPYPEKPMDAYNDSKAKAEQIVLEANSKGGLLTVALRPAGIFGPGDRQLLTTTIKVLEEGKAYIQIGDNTNMFDMTYVGNIAYAHLLAADKLTPPSPKDMDKVMEIFSRPLSPVDATLGRRRIPTSSARPLGPYVEYPANGEELLAAWNAPYESTRPVTRTRFDPFSEVALERSKSNPLDVAGQAFYISNGEPVYFWDFMRAIWRLADPETYPSKKSWVLPKPIGFTLASILEFLGWVVGKEPSLTRYRITFASAHRWHNIEKARRVLGYEPQVGIEEGLRRTMEWWKTQARS
ncbi:3-beta hydroxysteroid dehydrogenase/isomerase [Vararia minispora EC-137]|uniref:3-beta hydroxysteroid dehydrogenase/isomerase n=1 Tax=Vararia minispora EC-137 TaxID=1314806 RepID=A0ACB8QFJ2_9AGAM|nr:3-beta hydroxysteroid dehydrogenase/isomerase [Vararia minispora EC-137]